MATYRKKRRIVGPSKNEEKVQRARSAELAARSARVLGAQYPTVKRVDLKVVITSPQQQALEEKTMGVAANDVLSLSFPCPGRCGRGSFSLTKEIALAIEAAQEVVEGVLKCAESMSAGSSQACGCELKYRAQISYRPIPSEGAAA